MKKMVVEGPPFDLQPLIERLRSDHVERTPSGISWRDPPRAGEIWYVVPDECSADLNQEQPNKGERIPYVFQRSRSTETVHVKLSSKPSGTDVASAHWVHLKITRIAERVSMEVEFAPSLILGSRKLLAQRRAVAVRGRTQLHDGAPSNVCAWFAYGDLGQPQLVVRFAPDVNDKTMVRYEFWSAWSIGTAPTDEELIAPRTKTDGSRLNVQHGVEVQLHPKHSLANGCPTTVSELLEAANGCLRHITGVRLMHARRPEKSGFVQGEIVKVFFQPDLPIPCVVISPPQLHDITPNPLGVLRMVPHQDDDDDATEVIALTENCLVDQQQHRLQEVENGAGRLTIDPTLLRCVPNDVVEPFDPPIHLHRTTPDEVRDLVRQLYDEP